MKYIGKIFIISALAYAGCTSAQGTWDKSVWPKAEEYREGLDRDFHWKPGPSNQPIGTARGIFPGRVNKYQYQPHSCGRCLRVRLRPITTVGP